MFKRTVQLCSLALAPVLTALPAQAHFQLIHTGESQLYANGSKIELDMVFSHPGVNAHVMTMDKPISLLQYHKGEVTDLTEALQAIEYSSAVNSNSAWTAQAKARSMGDYAYVLTPTPYFEESEGIYIQQITKTFINVGGLPTDWSSDFGLSAEIVPLAAPYALYQNGNFRGVVKKAGQPVPFAEIEVEYLNYDIDMAANQFSSKTKQTYPNAIFETLTIFADENGTFSFTLPYAGYWGFAALGVGQNTHYRGKELSQDAVIWVQAHALK